jgi:hypothetical protein
VISGFYPILSPNEVVIKNIKQNHLMQSLPLRSSTSIVYSDPDFQFYIGMGF